MKKRGLLLVSVLMLFIFLTVACGSSEDNEESGEISTKEIELTVDDLLYQPMKTVKQL